MIETWRQFGPEGGICPIQLPSNGPAIAGLHARVSVATISPVSILMKASPDIGGHSG
jgi:hypothetical protein